MPTEQSENVSDASPRSKGVYLVKTKYKLCISVQIPISPLPTYAISGKDTTSSCRSGENHCTYVTGQMCVSNQENLAPQETLACEKHSSMPSTG